MPIQDKKIKVAAQVLRIYLMDGYPSGVPDKEPNPNRDLSCEDLAGRMLHAADKIGEINA